MYVVVEPPAKEPVTLEEVKAHLRINPGDSSEDQDILQPLIPAAREYCEQRTGRALAPQTLSFQAGAGINYFPRTPFLEVLSAQDGAGDVAYSLDSMGEWIQLPRPALVEYRAGYDPLPRTLRQAMLLLIAHWYANREAVVVGAVTTVEVAETVNSILSLYRNWWF